MIVGSIQSESRIVYASDTVQTPAQSLEWKVYRAMSTYNDDLYQIEREAAKALLQAYRETLAEHRTHHHVIRVWAVGGCHGVSINGTLLQQFRGHRRHDRILPVISTLRRIESSLPYNLAKHIAGHQLNLTPK